MITALLPIAANAVSALTSAAPTAAAATNGAGFSQAMTRAAGDALTTMKTAETTSMAGLQGETSVRQVVDSVMAAERTLQTALAIRDKAVAAYQQISQMQI